jgi:rubrerythrin
MSEEKKPEQESPWKIPQFKKLTRLADLLEKVADNEIEMSQNHLDKLNKLLQIKKDLEDYRNKGKKK